MAIFLIVLISYAVLFCGSFLNSDEFPGEAVKYSKNETEALTQFRKMMGPELYLDYMKSDVYLIRWLKARDFDLDKAGKMLRAALAWRKIIKLDGIQNETLWDHSKPPLVHLDGTDYEGNLVLTFLLGRWEARTIIMSGKKEQRIRYWFQCLDYMELQIMERSGVTGNKTGPGGDEVVVIMDADGFTPRQHLCPDCYLIYLEIFKVIEEYYPWYLKHNILINLPRAFTPLLQMLKTSVLSSHTNAATKLYWTNDNSWKPFLRKIVPPDQLWPPWGNRTK